MASMCAEWLQAISNHSLTHYSLPNINPCRAGKQSHLFCKRSGTDLKSVLQMARRARPGVPAGVLAISIEGRVHSRLPAMLATPYSVLGTRYSVLGTRYSVHPFKDFGNSWRGGRLRSGGE